MKKYLLSISALLLIVTVSFAQSLNELGRIDVSSAGSNNIMGVVVGPDGLIYFVDRSARKVYRIENSNVVNGDLSGYLSGSNNFVEIASGAGDGLVSPVDLDFNPKEPSQLWVINQGTDNSGGSTSTIINPGGGNQQILTRQDGNAWHFMALATSLAFGDNGNWATAQGILDANRSGGSFTGPTLWSADLDIYAQVGDPPNQQVNGSHLDMIHQSPYGMGIAHDVDNVYWVFDGYNDNVVRYDFVEPHYPGGSDHSDAIVRRYPEVRVERKGNLPAHMDLDKPSKMLFICDTDNGRILYMYTNTGSFGSNLNPAHNEPLAEYSQYTGVNHGILAVGLSDPIGIDVSNDSKFLIVSDNATNEIIIYNAQEATGIENAPIDEQKFSFNLYPNPSNGIVQIDASGFRNEMTNIRITNVLGSQVMNRMINLETTRTLDLNNLPAGIYQVSMENDDQFFTRKLIIN